MCSEMCYVDIFVDVQPSGCNLKGAFRPKPGLEVKVDMVVGDGLIRQLAHRFLLALY